MPLFKTHRHMRRYESNANFSLANASLLQIHVSGVNTWDEHWKYRDTAAEFVVWAGKQIYHVLVNAELQEWERGVGGQ